MKLLDTAVQLYLYFCHLFKLKSVHSKIFHKAMDTVQTAIEKKKVLGI